MSASELMPIPQNFRNNVDWILGAYTDANVTFPNGFQKDAIQNAVGARKGRKWDNWSCDISLIENEHGRFVVVEDSGTLGLTGENMHGQDVNAMMMRGETLPPKERLSRFTSMFNSGGNTTGGGLFGAGKSVYSVASQDYTYYFDSLREDGKYVANMNRKGQVYPLALEGDAAKFFIFEHTGLSEKETIGTRVIITSPKDELADSITSREIVSFIQESWWLIISRLGNNSYISVNGDRVTVPPNIKKKATHVYDLPSPEIYAPRYKVKHFGLYVFESGGNDWSTISYYRKGMKIGEVELKNIPEKLKGKFWGYIEVDEPWESELADIENRVHFGVSSGKKRTTTYQNLKNYCESKVRRILMEWGFIRDEENEDKKLRDKLSGIAEELQDLFDKLGFEDLGKGPQKSDFDVRWQNIHYPIPNTERVTTGDTIGFTVRITSSYTIHKKIKYKLFVENSQDRTEVSQIAEEEITIGSNEVFTKAFSFTVSRKNSIRHVKNHIVLVVKVIGSSKERRKELPFYYDIDKPASERESVSLVLHECLFPQQGSRRVNFGEAIRKVCYRIDNNRNHRLNYRLNISIHNASDLACPIITDVDSFTGTIMPFEDDITPQIEEITFPEELYAQHLTDGILELRARLIANEADEEFEKGEKITQFFFKIFFNRDEKHGKNDSFTPKSVDAPYKPIRSWHTVGADRSIFINVGHVAYLSLKDFPDIQDDYLREQMLKEYVLLYLSEGRFDMFGEDFASLEPQEAAPRVIEKIESVYYASLK